MSAETKTSLGPVRGTYEGELQVFRGIPFARPPVGERRFAAPEPAEPWSGTLDATGFRACALQAETAGSPMNQLVTFEYPETDESCLYLNVWTPRCDDARRPVLVWIHGGAFVFGSGTQAMYDGAALAARGDVVVVTLNYRLGALGFLHGASRCGSALDTTGNQGVQDQVAALRWVRSEIAAFGGDPQNVTAFGESAGSISLSALLAMPSATGLFERAILQSGSANLVLSPERASQATDLMLADQELTPEQGGALRGLAADGLMGVQNRATPRAGGVFYGPVIDGQVLPTDPFAAIENGSAAGVPVLIGTNLDENRFFSAFDPRTAGIDASGVLAIAERLLQNRGAPDGSAAAQVVEEYRKARAARNEDTSPLELFHALASDAVFRQPAMRLAELQARHAPVYAYLFDYASPIQNGLIGAGHLLEVPFVFGTTGHPHVRAFTGEGAGVEALTDRMQDAWLAFARTGDPGTVELPWPTYEADRRQTQRLGPVCETVDAPREPERAIWDQVLP